MASGSRRPESPHWCLTTVFGDSDGEPRQVVDVTGQQHDLRAAIAWVRDHDGIDTDRIALWGNSLGGAHGISVAASDPRIAAVLAQTPFNGFPRKAQECSTAATLRLLAAISEMRCAASSGQSPAYIR
jgi:dienelactone hydrolase